MIKLSDYVFRFLAGLRVKTVFLLPGGGAMHLVDSLGREKKLEYVSCLHEQAAVIAADAYAQYTGTMGVALVTTGPGGTNAVTGVAGAWIDSIPLMVLSGQVKRADMIGASGVRQLGNQEVDIVPVVKSITKYAVTIMDPRTIRYHLEKAVHLASSGRKGPVWLDIPLDVQGAMIDEKSLEGFDVPAAVPVQMMGAWTDEVLRLMRASRRPVILAGHGIHLAGAREDFAACVAALGIPVLTTWKGIDLLPEDHPLYFGRPGAVGQRGANFIQQNSDLLLALGTRLDLAQTGYDHANFCRAARKVIVDIDPAEIGKLRMKVDVAVCGDVKDFLQALMLRLQGAAQARPSWLARCRQWKESYPVVLPQYREAREPVNTYNFIDILSGFLGAEDVIVPGSSGSCSEITMQAFKVKQGQRIFNDPGLGAMGYGLPASMGACLASGRKRTITIIGDGGLQHNIQELETVARLKLPLKIFILNNNGYASIRNTQNAHFKGHLVACDPSSGLSVPDTCAVAAAYGIRHSRVAAQEDLCRCVAEALGSDGPYVCDIVVDPALLTAPRLLSEVKPDGTIVSKPMEDLWPFLDRKEFADNMIIAPDEKL